MSEKTIHVIATVEPLLDEGNVIGRLVTDKAGKPLKVKRGQGGKLEAKWDELDNAIGKAVEIEWGMFKPPGKSESYPFVAGLEFVEDELVQKEAERAHEDTGQAPPAPQAVGMTTKELGDMIRAKQLIPIFGLEAGAELVKWYRGQILGTTRVPFDGDKLPKIKNEKDGT